jgi:hypothetical protein
MVKRETPRGVCPSRALRPHSAYPQPVRPHSAYPQPVRPHSAARRLAAAAVWLLAGIALAALPGHARAQEHTLIFLTVKQGEQQAGGGTLFDTIAANHGPLQTNRTVTRQGVELDIYAVTRHKFGLAVGLELMDYDKTFFFSDPNGVQTQEHVRLDARSFLYTLKGFLRFGDFLPFAGIGTGTYYVSYNEQVSGQSFLDAANNVFTYRAGFRWLLVGRIGLLVEAGEISAPLRVISNNTTSTLELGGSFWNAGLSYVW